MRLVLFIVLCIPLVQLSNYYSILGCSSDCPTVMQVVREAAINEEGDSDDENVPADPEIPPVFSNSDLILANYLYSRLWTSLHGALGKNSQNYVGKQFF